MRNWTLPLAAAGLALFAMGTLEAAQDSAPQVPGQMNLSRVEAGTYTADPSHSLVGWRVNHFGFNDYLGLFGDVTGSLTFDPANPSAAKVDVTIPIVPVTASAGLTEHLTRAGSNGGKPDFFGPKPAAARFVSTKVEAAGSGKTTITGNLTLNGVTKPVTISADFIGAGTNPMNQKKTVGFEGRTTIKRTDWGISAFVPMVSDAVDLEITVAFEK